VNRILSYLVTAIVSAGFTFIGTGSMHAPKNSGTTATQTTNGAFRDGRYMAKLDVESGRQPHLSIGRWSTGEDRALYVAGYRQAYLQPLSADSTHDQNTLLQFQLTRKEDNANRGGCLPLANQPVASQ
jgi:hypothetical protein